MKPTLTIDDVAKATGLTRNTIQVYASQKKLGTKIGARRLFSQADVKKLAGGAKPAAKKAAPKAKKAAVKRAAPSKVSKAKKAAGHVAAPRKAEPQPVLQQAPKKSFFSFLGFGRKAKTGKSVRIADLVK